MDGLYVAMACARCVNFSSLMNHGISSLIPCLEDASLTASFHLTVRMYDYFMGLWRA